jgi:Uma2 family endonuclease
MCAMPQIELSDDIYYPESDGKPVAETPLHRDELLELVFRLRRHLAAEPSVYASGNMMMYYEPGNPRACFSPDVFIARGAGERQRRVFKIWAEACGPTVVIEVSSRKTAREDRGRKKDLCARLGVAEYWLYDPEGEYLDPTVQGWRLENGVYVPIPPRADGIWVSPLLDLRLQLDDGLLELYDPHTGARLLRPDDLADRWELARRQAEAAQRRMEAAQQAAAAAQQAMAAAESDATEARQRAAAAAAENARLRAEIERLRGLGSADQP